MLVFAVFDIDDSCGEVLDARRMDSSLAPVVNPCNSTNFNYAFVNNFYRGYRPSFSFGGDQLTFYATSWNDPNYYRVEINAKAYAGTKLSYLALGDSFSSGEGAWLDSEYLDGTNTGFDKCHISINSYPFIFARMSGLDMNYTKSVACSGAVMGDVIGEDDQYLGQGSRVKYYKPTLTDTDISNMQLSTLLSLTPGRIHQASFVQHNNPYIITIGIGGNDVGFADKLKACLGPDTCSWAGTAIGKEQTAIELRGIYSKLVDTYTSLHNDSPNSKIYVIGYPKLFDESGACGPLIGYLLNADERKFINEAVIYLNQVIKSASETTGVKYIDIADSFGDGAICGDAYPGSMNAVRLGDDFALINKFEWLRVIGQESFHPNILGHAQIATTIKNTVSNIGTYEYCNNGKVICPVVTLPPSPGEYWVPGIYHDYPKQVSTKFSADGSDDSTKTIKIPEYSLSPTSTIEITIASTPQSLGTFMTGDKGDFDKAITLPNGLEPGYHTIHINGLSYSGEKIDLYDVFAYKVPSNIETPISKSESDTPDNKVTLSSYSDNTELVAVIYPDHSQAIDNSNEPPKYSTSSGQVKGASTNIASVKPSNAISNNLIFVVVVVSGVSLVIMKLLAVRQLKRR